MGGCEGDVGGTPTQGGTPLEGGEQISFKVDRSVAASSSHSVHLTWKKMDLSNEHMPWMLF